MLYESVWKIILSPSDIDVLINYDIVKHLVPYVIIYMDIWLLHQFSVLYDLLGLFRMTFGL